jgi:hypothetical protein
VKFSVLLPTRNRLELLRYAVATVQKQDYADWEIIVSDNASDEDVVGFVRGLADPRVKVFRSERFVPVTENWNLALSHSSGDYVLMLGDDDCVLKGYFSRSRELLAQFDAPELVCTDAFQYAYPGVIPWHPEGFMQLAGNRLFEAGAAPYLLGRSRALALVRDSMRFRVAFGYNMQHYLVSRRLVEAMAPAGPFFQSPYPDYYAANAMLLAARRVLVVPRPMVTIGISPKSFGYYYFNRREAEGTEFLNNRDLGAIPAETAARILPGSDMNTAWLAAMLAVERNFGAAAPFPVSLRRYRTLQILATARTRGAAGLLALRARLEPSELALMLALLAPLALARILPARVERAMHGALLRVFGAYPGRPQRRKTVPYRNILELFERETPEYY